MEAVWCSVCGKNEDSKFGCWKFKAFL
uniref:Uncharacterized protein n=1 Tax=Vitis vinifera TaxID=29760 RepID=F6H940_VITVI